MITSWHATKDIDSISVIHSDFINTHFSGFLDNFSHITLSQLRFTVYTQNYISRIILIVLTTYRYFNLTYYISSVNINSLSITIQDIIIILSKNLVIQTQ